jgi:ABC-type transport system substrate-binding protein
MKFGSWKRYLVFSGIFAVILLVAKIPGLKKENVLATFVITETGKFTSLDPLDGDASQNLPVARMLYATPVEIFADNTLGSRVLESFTYERSTKTVQWIVRDGLTYSDGTSITADDIAFSVARMAFTRPGFPLIKLIRGLNNWLKGSAPLQSYPEGIKVSGNKITIQLTEDYPHPLFRFCLELFGIIPKKCVNLETNKVICEKVPTSGYYELKENGDRSLLFQKRAGLESIQGKKYPSQIQILYRDAFEAFGDSSLASDNTVILSSESKLTRDQVKGIESKFQLGFTPAAWFTILQINPNVVPFNDVECRFAFAEAFRRNYEKTSGDISEASVFTKIVAGYKGREELQKSVSEQPNKKFTCLEKFSHTKVPWGFDKTTPTTFVEAVKATAKELGIEITGPTEFKDRKDEVDNFISGKSALMYGRTGFWALDPTGDIQMLFTPNLHKGLQHFWKDEKLQERLNTIVKDGDVNMASVNSINSYLFADAKFNVYSHIRRFYASKSKDLVQHLPIGITSPSPWHLFGGN